MAEQTEEVIRQQTDKIVDEYLKTHDLANDRDFVERVKLDIEDLIVDEFFKHVDKTPLKPKTGSERKKQQWIEQGFGLTWNCGWLSFYSFFEKIGIVKNADFHRYHGFLRKGIWSIQFFQNWCILTQLPKKISRNAANRLNSLEGGVIEWRGGNDNNNYFINGVSFANNEKDMKLWERIAKDEITVNEIVRIENMEQRNAVLSVIEPGRLVRELEGKLISTHTQKKKKEAAQYMLPEEYRRIEHDEIHLYKVEGKKVNLDENIYVLLYKDPSTGREYFSFVEPRNATDAATAMASKFGLDKDKYLNNLITET